MNRRSLFSRSARPALFHAYAQRPDYFQVHVEPLEQRQLLAGNTYYVNDTWIDGNGGTLNFGDTVTAGAALDPVSSGIAGTYGVDCFGKSSTGSSDPSYSHIADAIAAAGSVDTVSLLEGTYTESDIVINKQVLFSGTGLSGTANTLIVPEVTSAHGGAADANFGAGTHAGVIIYSDQVTVQNVHLNGNGGGVGGSLNYHEGISTLYDTGGSPYSTVRNGSISPVQFGAVPDAGRPNRSLGLILIQNCQVDNVYWQGHRAVGQGGPAVRHDRLRGPESDYELRGEQCRSFGQPGFQPRRHSGDEPGQLSQQQP
jgi:hypothetical protein